jgi:hypothetical protein
VPLCIESPAAFQSCQPLTAGVPFPKGALADPNSLGLFDSEGRQQLLQTCPLAWWSDGSVKWLLLDFLLPCVGRGQATWLLRTSSPGHSPSTAQSVTVNESPGAVVIDTGSASFFLSGSGPQPIAQVRRFGKDLLDSQGTGTVLTGVKGRRSTPRIERLIVETRGPLRATVRLEGVFTGRPAVRFQARLSFFAGTDLARVSVTVHNPRRGRHPGGLWDLGDRGSMLFRDLSLEFALAGPGLPRVVWTAEPGQALRAAAGGPVEIYQDSSGGENWESLNHVNRYGCVPCSFRGYRVRTAGGEERGLRASPVLSLQGEDGGLTAAVPEFWQQFPKALEADGRCLRSRLFPGQFDDPFELQGGEQKTHTVWLDFGPGRPDAPLACDWAHRPARVHAPPEWYAATGAVPYLVPASAEPATPLRPVLAQAVRGDDSLFARREVIDEYGWRNFGECYADHEAAYYGGPGPVISHYNNQYDVVYGMLLQYLRTGDGGWFELLDPLARHVVDIDIYHTDRDRAAYNGGLFWHTDHYKHAATCTHRTFSRANQATGRPYGGGPCSAHNYTTGLLHHYFLTGSPASREAVVGLADWVVRMDDGRRNVLGLVDDGPTGLASFTVDLDYQGPGRGCGNSVNALLDGWLVTRRRAYLDKAEALIRRVIHPDDDVAARRLTEDVENRWSYTVFLAALGRYLDLKAEAGELDFTYAYARASLLRYAEWMLENETPYLDHPEKLEYPTETWAAQELRKANVLRLAAAHAGAPLRGRLLGRAAELADRGWGELLRFESRAVTRCLALLMTEGLRDAWFRAHRIPPPAPPPAEHDFGQPETFVPQRRRVLARLKTPRGMAGALLGLLNPVRWRNLIAAPHR